MAHRAINTTSFPLQPTRSRTPPSFDSLPISTSSYAINAPRSLYSTQNPNAHPSHNNLPRGLCLSGPQTLGGMPTRTVFETTRSRADSGSPPKGNKQMLERIMSHKRQGSVDSVMLGSGSGFAAGKGGRQFQRAMSNPMEDVFGKMDFIHGSRVPSLTASNGTSTSQSIRTQSSSPEAQSRDQALLNAKTLTLSPSTESVRRVAFDVAESALRGTEEDDGMDIEHRIRMVERKANAELRSKLVNSRSSSRSASPPHRAQDSKNVPPPIGSGLSAAAPAFEFKPKYTLPWEAAAAEQAGLDVLTYQRQNMLASQGVNFALEPQAADKFGLTSGKSLGNGIIEKAGHSRSKSDIPWTNAKSSPLILNSPAELGQPFTSIGERLEVKSSESQGDQEVVNQLPVPRSMTPLPFKRPTFTEEMLLPAAQLTSDNKEERATRRNGLPSLTEIRERALAKQAKQAEAAKPALRSKRYSLESQDSFSSDSNDSVGDGASLPSTPRRSRLPAFLQHRRTTSSGSVISDVAVYSPTKSVHFADEHLQFSPQPKTPQVQCPTLRVTPPSVEVIVQPKPTLLGASGRMQVMLEDDCEENSALAQIADTQRKKLELDLLPCAIPTISFTPATAPGIKISPLRVLEAQISQQKRKAEQPAPGKQERQQRSQAMMQTLRRRSDRGTAIMAA